MFEINPCRRQLDLNLDLQWAALRRCSYAAFYQRQSVSNRSTLASRITLERFIAEGIASREGSGFHVSLVIFTAVRRNLQILKPRVSNWNNASMRCRQQQQVLLQQLTTESTPCSPRRTMHLKLQ